MLPDTIPLLCMSDRQDLYSMAYVQAIIAAAGFNWATPERDRNSDDMYILYPTENDARKGMIELCRLLRKEGLHLNERKSSIMEIDELLFEET